MATDIGLLQIVTLRMRALLQKLYFNTWIRLPAKFVLTFALMKIGWDYSQHLTKWRRKSTNPRFCQFDVQSPINPPIPRPYYFYRNYEEYMDNKRWNRVQNDCLKLYTGTADRQFVFTDHPYRENINAIDQLMLRAKEYSCSEHLKFFIIAEYAKTGENVPQGVFREIREIHQPQVQANGPIIPKL